MSGYALFKADFRDAFTQLKPVIGVRSSGDEVTDEDLSRGRILTRWLDLVRLLAPSVDPSALGDDAEDKIPLCFDDWRPLALSARLLHSMRVDFEDLAPDRMMQLDERFKVLDWEDNEILDSLSVLRGQLRELLPVCEELPGLHKLLAAVDESIEHERLVIQDEEDTDAICAAREAFEARWVKHRGNFVYLSLTDHFAGAAA